MYCGVSYSRQRVSILTICCSFKLIFRNVQVDIITCSTLPLSNTIALPLSGPVSVLIDSATISNDSVQFTYTFNPEFYNVLPLNTIPAYVYDCLRVCVCVCM